MKADFSRLLEEHSKISTLSKREATFLEISGYPHYENVCSNILSFYIDPEREHGLSDLVLNSLLTCVNCDAELSNITVQREVATSAGRMDLVIQSDSHIIAIENKIFHTPENPFADYEDTIERNAGNRESLFLILGLRENKSKYVGKFVSVTYPELFTIIKANIGGYIQSSNGKYLTFLTEFITSIENLISGNPMNSDVIEFFNEHSKETQEFMSSYNAVKRDLRSKIENLKNMVVVEGGSISKMGLYRKEGLLSDCIYHHALIDLQKVSIDCHLRPSGWEISVYAKTGDMDKLKSSLEKRKIKFRNGYKFRVGNLYAYDHSVEEIATMLSAFIIDTQKEPDQST